MGKPLILLLLTIIMVAAPASVDAGASQEIFDRIHSIKQFREIARKEAWRVEREEDLASLDTVTAFKKYLFEARQQLVVEHRGSQDSASILARRLMEEEARRLKVIYQKNDNARQAALVMRCWANKKILSKAGNASLEVTKIAPGTNYEKKKITVVTMVATNTTNNKILRPRNYIVKHIPVGISMSDSFGNRYILTSVKPAFYGHEGYGIRPGESKIFKMRFADEPLPNARSIRISVPPLAFGQSKGATFEIPAALLFCGLEKVRPARQLVK